MISNVDDRIHTKLVITKMTKSIKHNTSKYNHIPRTHASAQQHRATSVKFTALRLCASPGQLCLAIRLKPHSIGLLLMVTVVVHLQKKVFVRLLLEQLRELRFQSREFPIDP